MNIEEQIKKLREELHDHNYRYYVLDAAVISDYDFDMKLKELQALEEAHPEFLDETSPTMRVGGNGNQEFQYYCA
jgi:DNA ligase (NAD+)